MTPDQPFAYPPPGPPAPGHPQAPDPFPGAAWPYGSLRPPALTASGVLGIVTGALTAMGCLFLLVMTVSGYGDVPGTVMLAGGVPCAIGTFIGGILVLCGRRRGLLLGSASAAVAVLLLTLFVGHGRSQGLTTPWMIVFALPLPVVTAVLAAHRSVKRWTEDARLG